MAANGTMTKTGAGKLKRLNYFHGMLLTEHHMREEQAYFREKLKLNNRLHGDGVVWGLCLSALSEESDGGSLQSPTSTVTTPAQDGSSESYIYLKPGVALDCAGNEIMVCDEFQFSIGEYISLLQKRGLIVIDDNCLDATSAIDKFYVGIRHTEIESDPSEQYSLQGNDGSGHLAFSRICEGFQLEFLTPEELHRIRTDNANRSSELNQVNPACPPAPLCCYEDQLIILGSVGLTGDPLVIQENEIDNLDYRKVIPSGFSLGRWASTPWDSARDFIVQAIAKRSTHIDVSRVHGMRLQDGSQWLNDNLSSPVIAERSVEDTGLINNLAAIEDALPYAPEMNANITLILEGPEWDPTDPTTGPDPAAKILFVWVN